VRNRQAQKVLAIRCPGIARAARRRAAIFPGGAAQGRDEIRFRAAGISRQAATCRSSMSGAVVAVPVACPCANCSAPDKIDHQCHHDSSVRRMRVCLSLTVAAALAQQRALRRVRSVDQPSRRSNTSPPTTDTVVDRLNQKLRDGSAKLEYDPQTGYIKSVLRLLDVPSNRR
jgi:hypothetical protein